MKRHIIIISALLCCTSAAFAQTQVTNGDFETWTYDGANLPNNWNSFQTADGSLSGSAYSKSNRQVERSTDVRPGTSGKYSVRIWTRKISVLFIKATAQGNLTTGRVHADAASATDQDNYNYSDRDGSNTNNGVSNPCAMKFTGKPDAMSVWVKFSASSSTSKARVAAYIHSDCDFVDGYAYTDDKNDKTKNIAYAEKTFTKTSGWVNLIIPFTYTNGDKSSAKTPSYILLTCSTNASPGQGDEGDSLWIDDIEMIYYQSYTANFTKGWASMYLDYPVAVPSDVTAYYATEMINGYVKLKEIPAGSVIPAKTGVILKSSKSSVTFKQSTETPVTISGNILTGTVSSATPSGTVYVLSPDGSTTSRAAFGLFTGSKLAANKAYIKM